MINHWKISLTVNNKVYIKTKSLANKCWSIIYIILNCETT
jgi:hypothetical protein